MTPGKFRSLVFSYHALHGRNDLPWRKTRNPYRILVSEVMLQQTQVERVIPYYRDFLKRFPSVAALAAVPLSEVLRAWQGLGYNRRAKMLHEAAKAVMHEHSGRMPRSAEQLRLLPGVGPYTAGAVAAFAYNEDVLLIETNIRTAVTHHFFQDQEQVSDAQVLEVLAKTYPQGEARTWYAALMDYGSHLKRSGIRINHKKEGYVRQPAFKGSDREVRGVILKALTVGPLRSFNTLLDEGRKEQLSLQLQKLIDEGLVEKKRGVYQLRD